MIVIFFKARNFCQEWPSLLLTSKNLAMPLGTSKLGCYLTIVSCPSVMQPPEQVWRIMTVRDAAVAEAFDRLAVKVTHCPGRVTFIRR